MTEPDARPRSEARRVVQSYAWFGGLITVVFGVCYALGLDTLFVGYSRARRIIQPGAVTAVSLGFLFWLRSGALAKAPLPAAPAAWRRGRTPAFGLAALAALAAAAIAVLALQSVRLSGDEGAYAFQASLFAHGALWAEPSAIQPYTAQSYIFPADGKLISQYPPGWPAILAAAGAVGVPYVLVNPALGALMVLALWRFALARSGQAVAVAAAAMMAASAFFLFNSASFYNGNAVALFAILFVGSACAFLDRPSLRAAAGLGAWFSAIAVTRHLDAMLFALPVAVALLRRGTPRHWAMLPAAAGAALPLLGLTVYYYAQVTGHWLVLPQTLRNPNDGLLGLNWHAMRVTEILAGRAVELAEWVSPLFVAALAWALAQKLRRGQIRFFDLYGPVFLAGYWLYWADGGLRWGPRYIYPALPFMALAVADYAGSVLRARRGTGFIHVVAVSTLVSALQLPFLALRARDLIDQTQDVQHQVRDAGLHHAVVVIVSGTGRIWSIDVGDLARNSPALDGDVVYAHGRGLYSAQITPDGIDQAVQALRAYFPGRDIWLYRRDEKAVHGHLAKA